MKTVRVPLSEVIEVISPQYVYVKLTPNNSIRNNSTHLLAKTISSLYRSLWAGLRKEEQKVLSLLGK